MKNIPKMNSVWCDNDSNLFRITQLEIKNKSVWVYYKNEQTEKNYQCLSEAFISRYWATALK